jgi:hypothetical protein
VGGSSADFSTATSITDQIMDISGFGSVTDFETISGGAAVAGATVNFDLVSLLVPNGGAGFGNCASNAANNQCNPAGSPFVLEENSSATGVTIQLTTSLEAYTGTSASGETAYTGTFNTQINGSIIGLGSCSGQTADITEILECQSTGGTIDATWSATESPSPVSVAPEPGTLGMIVAGACLVVLGVFRRKRNISQQNRQRPFIH